MYSHDKLLRPLQGLYVPCLIGAYKVTDDYFSVIMEPLDDHGWTTADSSIADQAKLNIRHAYAKLHARGILHGLTCGENILVGMSQGSTAGEPMLTRNYRNDI